MTNGVFTATVPSNIAFIKYWGKRDPETQWPANDSLSMTLSQARTQTTASAHDGPADLVWRDGRVYSSAERVVDKAIRHLDRMRKELPEISRGRRLMMQTHNTFPTDCGIASSASGLGALTLAALAAWTGAGSLDELALHGFGLGRLANLARLGSGSACRSFFGGYALWQAGARPDEQRVSQIFTANDWQLADVIAIVSKEAKPVPSTTAHAAAWTSPLFEPRLSGIDARLARVRKAIATQDLESLGDLIETEALEMHSVMMTSTPSVTYMTEATSRFLSWLRKQRRDHGLPAFFTLDAGPNPHVICEKQHAPWVASRINAEFPDLELIMDATGTGPTLTRGESP